MDSEHTDIFLIYLEGRYFNMQLNEEGAAGILFTGYSIWGSDIANHLRMFYDDKEFTVDDYNHNFLAFVQVQRQKNQNWHQYIYSNTLQELKSAYSAILNGKIIVQFNYAKSFLTGALQLLEWLNMSSDLISDLHNGGMVINLVDAI